MDGGNIRHAIRGGPAPPADLDADESPPQRPEDLGVGRIVADVDGADALPARPIAGVLQEASRRRRLPRTAGRDEVPDAFARDDSEPRPARDRAHQPAERADPGSRETPVVDRECEPLRLEPRPREAHERLPESRRGRAQSGSGSGGARIGEPEARPPKLKAVAATVEDPREPDAATQVGEGAPGEDREPESLPPREPPEGLTDRGVEPRRLRPADDGRQGAVEVEDEEDRRARGPEPVREPAERRVQAAGPFGASTGSRQRSPRRRPAQR